VDQSDWLPMMIATGFGVILLPEIRKYFCGRKRRIIGWGSPLARRKGYSRAQG
jgi:hypothetical protein